MADRVTVSGPAARQSPAAPVPPGTSPAGASQAGASDGSAIRMDKGALTPRLACASSTTTATEYEATGPLHSASYTPSRSAMGTSAARLESGREWIRAVTRETGLPSRIHRLCTCTLIPP